MFKDCLSSHGKSIVESISEDIAKKSSEDNSSVQLDPLVELADDDGKRDVALKNLEGGDEAIGLAARWMAPDERGLKKLQRIQEYIPESVKVRLEKIISQAEARIQALAEERPHEESQIRSEWSQETDEDRYDDKGTTAHRIFAGSSFIQSERGSSDPSEEEAKFYTPVSSPRGIQNHPQRVTISPTPPSTVFDQEYADWFTPITPTKERPNPLPKTPEPRKTMNVLSPSTNNVNMVRRSIISKPPLVVPPNPSDSAPTSSFTSSLLSSSTKGGSKTPPSPSTISRREKRKAEREERRRTALKLGRARPDLVSEEFTERFLTSTHKERS